MMNQEQMKGKIQKLRGIAKQQWSKLTDEDFREGSIDYVVGRITELYGTTKEEAQKKIDELMKGIEKSGDSGSNIADNIHKMADKLADAAEHGQQKLEEATDSIKHQTHEWYEYMDKCVKEKPLTTLAVALGLGALIGSMMGR